MWHARRLARSSFVLSLLLLSSTAQAQWVFLGRKAVGKIRTMTQQEATGSPGYSVAEVVVQGKAEKVYATALKTVQDSKARLTRQDAKNRQLEFVARDQVFGMRISQVDSKVVHILIASTVQAGKPDATAELVEAIIRLCREMKATCEQVK